MVQQLGGYSIRQIGTLISEVAGAAVILAGIVRNDLAWITAGAGLLGAPSVVPDRKAHPDE